ncbi:transcriptional regulator, AraC family [Oceanospirillum multiglobuliferum]|uniref:AraC family transcriptional regulator n=1 Tax=Oceanospirillum multiglobuliferum TaxID=64969 RepID=A0A1T4M3M1_9GAMM|nr:AraC family transcriptional regulator [Oceanospirillum multiglobuliferum]OPX56263.1 AraC family transcriptional regulator [Oceanospirillum multiglobuliferum]SJZ61388.1 transcriptional regulator, AraC family [Oceanospirillum multiglobuliferum]
MKADSTTYLERCPSLPYVEMRTAVGSAACYHAHSHDEFSFGVIEQGRAIYQNGKAHYAIQTGHTVTINPGDIHACNPDNQHWSYRMLFVDSHWFGALQQELLGRDDFDYQPFLHHHTTAVETFQRFKDLFNTLQTEPNALQAESHLIEFVQHCFQPNLKSVSSPAPILEKAKEKLLDELAVNHSLVDLAQEVGLSRYHFLRSFKQAYGLSPHALQLDERIKKAKVLLKNGCSIVSTASELGFADQSHLQRNFKRRLALTPKQYQSFFS